MCGIFCFLSNTTITQEIVDTLKPEMNKIKHRGPDNTVIKTIDNILLGFHRLAIIDPSEESNQPLELNGNYLICNGEIYNYKDFKFNMKTKSDCEVILHLYEQHGIDYTVKRLDAEYAFILYDSNKQLLHIARDPYGIRPLFIGYNDDNEYYFSSEAKALTSYVKNVKQFDHRSYMTIDIKNKTFEKIQYYSFEHSQMCNDNIETIYNIIHDCLTKAVHKRLIADRPIGCLLSGGLDSSLIVSIASKKIPDLHCFSIGIDNSVDIIAAKEVSKFLNIKNHHVITFSIEEGLNSIRDVIYQLETYDITTIRASCCQYLLAKYIAKNTNIKVLLSGEGSDEMFQGYKYYKNCRDKYELQKDGSRLLRELPFFDNLRSDRTISGHGLELRVPFLDRALVNCVMSIDPVHRLSNNRMEKYILRKAFEKDDCLPKNILWRPKEAFSDAVSSKEVSWRQSIINYVENKITNEELSKAGEKYSINTPQTKEALYYRNIFNELYPNRDNFIPHYWMPKWVNDKITDPSATILHKYDSKLKTELSSD